MSTSLNLPTSGHLESITNTYIISPTQIYSDQNPTQETRKAITGIVNDFNKKQVEESEHTGKVVREFEIQGEEVVEGEKVKEKQSEKESGNTNIVGIDVQNMNGLYKELGRENVSGGVETTESLGQQSGSSVAGEDVEVGKESVVGDNSRKVVEGLQELEEVDLVSEEDKKEEEEDEEVPLQKEEKVKAGSSSATPKKQRNPKKKQMSLQKNIQFLRKKKLRKRLLLWA
ncbi:PREDICTED: uncharacterized protein LOC109230242 [Nicotiana attenuata]|uniref:uncharacterized protein LOC109230242 n=1 Tax=Nicotiana attenuata TaxID=49451 RepID=UPI0009050051|nr:PREDICTED: uncharacterized protein LOC109230242 [Nicotiana attenuata]